MILHVCSLLLAALSFSGSTSDPCASYRSYCRLAPDIASRALSQQRFLLEARHVGGARREVVEELLATDYATGDPAWAARVLEFCKDGTISCVEYAPLVAERIQTSAPDDGVRLSRVQAAFRCESALQNKTRDQRRDIYLAALNGDPQLEISDCGFNWANVCRRAASEGMPEVVSQAEKTRVRRGDTTGGSLLTIYKALVSEKPDRELIRILRQSVLYEVSISQKSQKELSAAYAATQEVIGTGHLAVVQLRRRNAPALIDELRAILRLYDGIRDQYAAESKRAVDSAQRDGSRAVDRALAVRPTSYLMQLGWEVAEAIGDLGDREFERATLGGRTLWDQVHEAEEELARQGKIRRSEMVSQ